MKAKGHVHTRLHNMAGSGASRVGGGGSMLGTHHEGIRDSMPDVVGLGVAGGANSSYKQAERGLLPRQERNGAANDTHVQVRLAILHHMHPPQLI